MLKVKQLVVETAAKIRLKREDKKMPPMRIVLRIRKAFSTMHSVCRSSKLHQSCPTLRDPMDYSLPGSSIHGILQARILEQVAISFSNAC